MQSSAKLINFSENCSTFKQLCINTHIVREHSSLAGSSAHRVENPYFFIIFVCFEETKTVEYTPQRLKKMGILSLENILLTGSILLIAGVLIGKSGYRSGLPVLMIFLIVGMFFGTDGLGIQFDDMNTAQFIGMIALCVILFTGGMATRYSAIKPILGPGLTLSTAGVLLTALLTGLFVWWLSDMKWTNIHFAILPSILLAATMSSTDSASVFGILGSQKVSLKNNLRPMLELESGSNDPMAYMLTIILIDAIGAGNGLSPLRLISELIMQFAVGGAMGWIMGKATIRLAGLYRRLGNVNEDPDQTISMLSILILALMFFTFAVTTDLKGNGYLAVYIAGMIIGNSELRGKRGINKFLDGLTWLAQIVVFIMLGLLVNPREMIVVAPVSLLIGVFMIVVARPVSVFLSLLPFRKIKTKSKCYISWVGLRGAVPIIFATYPVIADIEGAGVIFNIVFFVTLLSLIVQGTTVIKSARVLGLIAPEKSETDNFGVELPEDIPSSLRSLILTEEMLSAGDTLSAMDIKAGQLVMMVRRGDRYLVPNGKLKLLPGDTLLIIEQELRQETK